MRFSVPALPRLAAGIALGVFASLSASAAPLPAKLSDAVDHVEKSIDARVGLTIIDTGSGETWSHRPEERFLMNSTVKVTVCGAILAQKDAGALSLAQTLPVRQSDVLEYAPVTAKRAGKSMNLDELCLAALDMSDNTATNLLIDRLGGPKAVTAFFRSIGDTLSRLDRMEPELNDFAKGDPRDTTTPLAMSETLETLLVGEALAPASREQLAEWMSHGGVTANLLRPHAPDDWQISDKSGSGSHTRNLVAMITPPDAAPWIVTIFVSDVEADFATRNGALKEISAAVMAEIRKTASGK